jgi:hypothetical protein
LRGLYQPCDSCVDTGVVRLALLISLLAACSAPVVPLSPSPTVVTSAAPTVAVSTPAPSTATAPTPIPTPAPTSVGPVRNDGQVIVVDLPRPSSTIIGEAGPSSPVLTGSHWRMNGTALTNADIVCTRRAPASGDCAAVRIITDKVRLRNGSAYEIVLDSDVIGTFVASGLVTATPHVVSVKATQFSLTVQFDRPMLHTGECGSPQGWTMTTPGTIENVRSAAAGFPAPLGAYSSTSAAYDVFLSAFVSQAVVSPDCTTVTFGSGWGGPTGKYDLTIVGVLDRDGNVVQPRTFDISVADEGAPTLMFAQLELQTAEKKVIRVAYSEAMDEEYVTDPERYYLNGRPIPLRTKIECEVAGCTWVRLTFAPDVFAYGADNVLSIVEVRDMAGVLLSPNIATSGTFQVR